MIPFNKWKYSVGGQQGLILLYQEDFSVLGLQGQIPFYLCECSDQEGLIPFYKSECFSLRSARPARVLHKRNLRSQNLSLTSEAEEDRFEEKKLDKILHFTVHKCVRHK
jgi:hypothetical protein